MDSLHIGCKEHELIYINTSKFDLIIKGKPCHPKSEVLSDNNEDISELKISCCEECVVEVFKHDSIKCYHKIIKLKPLFYENQDYQVIIESKGEYDIKFWHDNNLLRQKIGYVGKAKRTLSGVINFKNEVGLSEFKIIVNGMEYLSVNIEIFPSKIDYKNDYINILLDVNKEVYNLAFDFIKKTYFGASINKNTGNSLTEFFSIIYTIFEKLKFSVDVILRSPHHVLHGEKTIVPYHKLKKVCNDTLKWLQKNPKYLIAIGNKYIPQKAQITNKIISFDTFENRFVKFVLKTVIKKLENLKNTYLKLDRKIDEELINKIEYMQREMERRIDTSFLKNVREIHFLNFYSLVLNMAPGYKDVYKYYLMLVKGLSLNGDIFRISIKDLALLYEYWCFVKLSSILKNKYKLINQDYIKINNYGLFVTLKKGKEASVTYENYRNGERFTITYSPQMIDLPTTSQKPDNVLTLEKEKSKIKYKYIFDAKYRINPSLEGTYYNEVYKYPGPEEEDINTMHRYRDAIVYENKDNEDFKRTMFGAYILFPYKDEDKYVNHKFYQSIEKVNVGGLPFLPSAINLVEKFLEDLIEDTPQSAFERTVLPNGINEYVEIINFEEKNVLIGPLKNKNQLDIILNNKFYHIPYFQIKNNLLGLKYIAIYQSKDQFGDDSGIRYYGKIKSWQIIKRKEIKEIPKLSEEEYIKFEVEEWKVKDPIIKAKEYGVRTHIYTNYELLMKAEYLPELCIKNKEEYRLYLEIKRLIDKVKIDITDENINGFLFENSRICIENKKIKIFQDSKYNDLDLKEFLNKPRTTIKRIKEIITK